jgi:GAF domain-containing protein
VTNEVQTDLAGLQNALLETDTVEQFLYELAVLAARAVGDGDAMSCGIALGRRGSAASTTACSDPLASQADRVQYQSGDGPALEAMRRVRPVSVRDTATAPGWPRFCLEARSLGIRSCYAVPLVNDGESVGALILYARRPDAFGPERARQAERFAGHAVGALTLSLRMASCADQNDQLRSSIMSRAVIDQALGVIMATERCPQDRAFAMLRTVSQNRNVKIRDLAATIVTQVSGEPPKPTAPFENG